MSRTYFRNLKADLDGAVKNRWERFERPDEIRGFTPRHSSGAADIWTENDGTDAAKADEETAAHERGALGFVYADGPQKLSVTVPGDAAAIQFNSHTVLSGLRLCGEDVIADKPGIYEIGYYISLKASCAVRVVIMLQANGRPIEGSAVERTLDERESAVGTSVLAALKENDAVRLVMTAGTAVNAELTGGVSASMSIKKLD